MNPSRVLNIGCTSEYACNDPRAMLGKGIELEQLDIDPRTNPDYVLDIREPMPKDLKGAFDAVFASHVLEHVERGKVNAAVENFKYLLRVGGQLWVFVPSLEWACREVLEGRDTIAVHGVLYGGQKDQWDIHLTGYTKPALRALIQSHGFKIDRSEQTIFTSIVNGESQIVSQNLVVGVKQ